MTKTIRQLVAGLVGIITIFGATSTAIPIGDLETAYAAGKGSGNRSLFGFVHTFAHMSPNAVDNVTRWSRKTR